MAENKTKTDLEYENQQLKQANAKLEAEATKLRFDLHNGGWATMVDRLDRLLGGDYTTPTLKKVLLEAPQRLTPEEFAKLHSEILCTIQRQEERDVEQRIQKKVENHIRELMTPGVFLSPPWGRRGGW